MKKLAVLLSLMMVLFVFAVSAMAAENEPLGFTIEGRAASNEVSSVTGYFGKTLVGPLGVYIYAEQDRDGYRQAYAGPTLQPFEWLQVGAGVGLEHVPDMGNDSNSTRYNAFVDLNYKMVHAYACFENGNASSAWHQFLLIVNPTEKFGIGIMDEKIGFGPRIELNLIDGVKLWGAYLFHRSPESEEEETKDVSVIGVSFSF